MLEVMKQISAISGAPAPEVAKTVVVPQLRDDRKEANVLHRHRLESLFPLRENFGAEKGC
jgi:hypothetical protein